MKIRIIMILTTFFAWPILGLTQNSTNMTKTYVGTFNKELFKSLQVYPGECRCKWNEYIINGVDNTKTNRFYAIIRDIRGKIIAVQANNVYLNFSNKDVDVYRIGYYPVRDIIYSIKENTHNDSDSDNNLCQYYIYKGNNYHGPYDKVFEIQSDGYIVKNKGAYYHHYFEDQSYSTAKIYTITDKEDYKLDVVECVFNGEKLSFKPHSMVSYFNSYTGHYYLTYHDVAMENTLLVVDSIGYELKGEKAPLFNFSYNGNHWIAATDDVIIVDGTAVDKGDKNIINVLVKDNGSYAYVIGGKEFSDKIFVDGKLLVKGVEVKNITIDGSGHFNSIVENDKGLFNCIDNEVISMKDELEDYIYPGFVGGRREFTVKSDDGLHYMNFNYDRSHIVIDGKPLECNAVPHYAHWNGKKNSFEWNVVENMKIYLYKYKVK